MNCMHFLQGLRDSVEPIKGMCMMRHCNELMTYDSCALRVWNLQKPIKVVYHKESKEEKFLKMLPIEKLQCVALFFTRKAGDSISTVIKLVSRQLSTLQEVELKIVAMYKIQVSECENTLLVEDATSTLHVYHMQVIEPKVESSSVSADFNNIFLTTKPSVPRQQVEKKSDLLRLHLLDSLDMKENGIKDFASLNTHVIMLLAKTGLLFYTRSALLKPLPEKKKALFDDENVGVISRAKSRSRTRRSIESSADEAVKKAAAAAASSKNTSVYQEFRHSSSLTISYYEAAREISSMRVMADQMVFVAYTDGLVQCIQYQSKHLQHDHSKDNSPSISDTSYNPANVLPSLVLCELFVSGKDKVPLFNMFLNTSCKTYGSCSFMMEFFMFTEDFKLSLYGVRQTDRRFIRTETVTITNEEDSSSIASKEEKAEVPRVASKGPAESVSTAYVETLDATIGTSYLAEFDLISEFQIKERDASLRKAKYIDRLLHNEFNVVLVDSDTRRKLLCNVGGMIYMLELLPPYNVVVRSKWLKDNKTLRSDDANALQLQKRIRLATRGPDLYSMGDDRQDLQSEEDIIYPTLLLLKEDCIDLLSGLTGQVIQTVQLSHILSSSAMETTYRGSVAKDRQLSMVEKDLEGKVCVFHWCPYSTHLIVGFTTGLVGVVDFQQPVHSYQRSKPDFSYFRSNEVHTSEITLMKSFIFTKYAHFVDDPLHPENGKDIVVLLLGDASGVISLWQLSPLSSSKSPLLFTTQQHLGSLQYACLCSVPLGLITKEEDEMKNKARMIQFDHSASELKDSNHKILVTCCSNGRVYVWRVEKNLTLSLMAFFHSSTASSKAKVTSCLALPKMVYRKINVFKPKVITSSAASVESSAESKKADKEKWGARDKTVNTIPVANLYYEIYVLLGYGDGQLEVYNVSSDARYCTTEPIFSLRELQAPLISLVVCNTDSANGKTLEHDVQHQHPNCISSEFTLVNHPQDFLWDNPEESPYPNSAIENLLCGFEGGTVVAFELKINPFYALDEAVGHRLEVKRLNYQHIPIKLCNLLPLHRHSVVLKTLRVPSVISVWDYAYVGEFDVLQVLPYIPISKALPYKWRNEWRLKADGISNEGKAEANPFVLDECPVVLRDDTMLQAEFGKGEIDILEEYSQRSSQAMEEEASIESVQDNNSASLSHRGESVASLLSMSTASSAFYRDKKQYVGPMETMQRIISSDLYVAKKDRRLLEMFTQNADSNTFTIPADKVIEIVANWCNGIQNSQHTKATTVHEIRTENLKELFKLLDIQPSDEMRFVEVAKIAAITLSAVKKGMEIAINAPQPAIQQKMYKNLRKQMTKVSYNSMGERVVEKITLSNETMGLPTGTVALVKNALASFLETHRSAIQLIKSMPDNLVKSRRLLEKLPASLLKIISPIKLPVSKDKWCADHLHYFDELRTLVIARALFDMRSSSQFEAMQSRDIMKSGAHQVLSMPMLLIKYFERLYGECHVTMNVSRHKISNYLEACMQYTYFPLLNILKSSLYLDNMMINFSSSEVALWLINEARNLLISRGLVIAGNSLTAMDKGLMQDVNNASSVASRHACWLYITKSNATAICDELLRVRGQFGPHMYLSIMDIVNGIATVSSSDDDLALSTAHEVLHEGDIIDLEKFLEVLFYEYVRQNERIRSLRKRVFGEFSVNVASVAVSREINTQAESKRVTTPINDEIDAGFGSYHSTNLRKIQELLSFCMQHDALRTGQVGAEIMQQAFKTVLYDNHRVEDRGYEGDAYRAMLAVKNQMKIRSIEDQLSYIDVVAMLLAWEEHHQGFKLVSLPWLLASLPPIQRGIETSLAKDLVKLFSLVSSLNNVEDPVWVVRSTLASGSMQLDDSLFKTSALSSVANVPDSNPPTALSIPMEGNWKTGPVAVPADEPGLLLAQAISTVPSPVVHVRSAVQLPKYEEHRREIEHLVAPSVLETARSSATLTGEAVNPVFSTKKQASITVKKLDMEIPLPRSAYTPGYEVIDHGRQSFSRVMQRISMEGTESPTNTAKGLEIELRREIDLDPLPEPIFASVSTPGKEPERQTYDIGMSLDTFHSQFSDTESSNMLVEDSIGTMDSNYQQYDLSLVGDEIIPRNSQNVGNKMVGGSNSSQVLLTPFLDVKDQEKQRSQLSQVIQALQDDSVNVHDKSKLLADEVVSRRIEELQYVEEVFQTEFEQEKEEFEKRRLEKEALREKLRQEMLLKEKEAMKVYRKSLMERSERMKKARAHLSAMEEAEAEQRRQKEKDIQAILNRNRSRALNKLDERTSKEKSQALREREANEAILMKKEEKLSMRIELIIREEKRLKLEADRKEEEDALERRLAEIAAQHALDRAAQEDPSIGVHRISSPNYEEDEDNAGDDFKDLPSIKPEERRPKLAKQKSLLRMMHQEGEDDSGQEEEEGEGREEGDEYNVDDVDDQLPIADDLVFHDFQYDSFDPDRPLTAIEKRIQLLLRNIKQGIVDQRSHPRKQKGLFTMPLLFSTDIAYSPFTANTSQLVQWTYDVDTSVLGANAGEAVSVDEPVNEEEDDKQLLRNRKEPFADLDAAIRKYRRRQEQVRTALFKTQVEEIRAADWTNVVKVAHADWDAFFGKQEARLEMIKAIARDKESIEPEDTSMDRTLSSPESMKEKPAFSFLRASVAIPADVLGIPKSLMEALPDDVKGSITPLPFGKVLRRQQVYPQALRFFQIEVVEDDCVLTVEIKCVKGLADMYIHCKKLPSTVKYLQKVSCTKENNRLARITLTAKEPGTYFAAVTSSQTGAEFDIWSYGTSESVAQFSDHDSIMKRVTTTIDKFNILAANSIEDLQVHFPRLEQEALRKSEVKCEDTAKLHKRRRAVLKEMKLLMQSGRLDSVMSKPFSSASTLSSKSKQFKEPIDEEDVVNMESFVVKVGRFAMRKEREMAERFAALELKQLEADVVAESNGDQQDGSDGNTRSKSRSLVQHSMDASPLSEERRNLIFAAENPNQHADLFSSPVIHRHRSINLLTPLQQFLAQQQTGDDTETQELLKLLEEEAKEKAMLQNATQAPSKFENVTAILASKTPVRKVSLLRQDSEARELQKAMESLVSVSDNSSVTSMSSHDMAVDSHPVVSSTASRLGTTKGVNTLYSGSRPSEAFQQRPGFAQPSMSLSYSESHLTKSAAPRSKLEITLDQKGKIRQPKVSCISNLIFVDPKPVSYKLSKTEDFSSRK